MSTNASTRSLSSAAAAVYAIVFVLMFLVVLGALFVALTGVIGFVQSVRAVSRKGMLLSAVPCMIAETHTREHKVFAGKLDRSTLGLTEMLSVRLARAREGDWRDWQAIDEWAKRIADVLQPEASAVE